MIWRDSLGSDVSLLAAWDASLPALSSDQQAEYDWVGKSEAGEVFLVALGEESQAHMTVVSGEPWPTDMPPLFCSAKQPYLLHLPSGRLRLDSTEFYREIDPALVEPEDVAIVPPGNYLLHCHIAFLPEAFHAKASNVIGADDYAYYRSRTGGVACPVGCTLMLGAPPRAARWLAG